MKIFISWSKDISHQLATFFHGWLPRVLPVDPWVSSEDIAKGLRWNRELNNTLRQVTSCIVCINSSNLQSPWLNFEAGAISRAIQGKVFPLLIHMSPSKLEGHPLAAFQMTVCTQEDIYRLLQSLNKDLGEAKIPEEQLRADYDQAWPDFKDELESIEIIPSGDSSTPSGASQLGKEEIELLKVMAGGDFHDQTDIADHAALHPVKVRVYLKKLSQENYIRYSHLSECWKIDEKGENFLVENHFI